MAQQALQKPNEEKALEFVPFGGKTAIKLTRGIVRSFIANKTKSGKEPSDQEIVKFMFLCQARLLNPFEGDAFLVGYDGKDGPQFSLITAHQAFLKRAEVSAEYDGMQSGVIVARGDTILDLEGDFYMDGDQVLGGWATVFFKTRTHPMRKRLRLSARAKNNRFWTDDAAGMIVKCAEADALRSSFPTTLGGLYVEEELAGVQRAQHVEQIEDRPPVGRVSLRPPKRDNGALEHRQEPPPEREPGVEEEAPSTADALERDDMVLRLNEQIAKAASGPDLDDVEAELRKHRDFLGKDHALALGAACKEKATLLSKRQTTLKGNTGKTLEDY